MVGILLISYNLEVIFFLKDKFLEMEFLVKSYADIVVMFKKFFFVRNR